MLKKFSRNVRTIVRNLTGKERGKTEHSEVNEIDLAPTKPYEVLKIPRGQLRVVQTPQNCAVDVVTLHPGFLVGRGSSCNLIVADPNVSRVHACFVLTDLSWEIKDNSSSNGTFINGERIKSAKLKTGDQIMMGQTVLIFEEQS